nr:hypothetical protein [uncultured Noviherbaspirillum sp.]
MPKTPLRGHPAKTVRLQVPLRDVHCRHLERELEHANSRDRLRGSLQLGFLVLRPRPRRDSLFQRVVHPDTIGTEKMVARAALASAANNLSPARIGQLGSPGQRAVRALYALSAVGMGSDIRVGQVRSVIALLAGARKKQTFGGTPVKTHKARVARNGAAGLASAESVRRVQLNRFCMDSAASASLTALLAGTDDATGSVAASLSIFRAAVQSFILEALLGSRPAPQESIARQIRKSADSPLLRLFIALWRRATVAGKIAANMFPWFDAVDWLVNAMLVARPTSPTSPGATRVPKSPRIVSPAALMLRRAQAATPQPPVAVAATPPSPAATGTRVRQVRGRTVTQSGQGRSEQPDSPFKARPRPGRQGQNVQIRYQTPGPRPLAASPAAQPLNALSTPGSGALHAPGSPPAPGVTGDCPISPGGHVLAGATLGDIAHHLAAKASTMSGVGDTENEALVGAPGTPGTCSSTEELSPDYGH